MVRTTAVVGFLSPSNPPISNWKCFAPHHIYNLSVHTNLATDNHTVIFRLSGINQSGLEWNRTAGMEWEASSVGIPTTWKFSPWPEYSKHYQVNTVKTPLNRTGHVPEGNTGKYLGKGGVTTHGRCEREWIHGNPFRGQCKGSATHLETRPIKRTHSCHTYKYTI